MKYIPEEELKAEIERRIQRWTIRGKHSPAGQGRDSCDSRVTELSDLLSFITSLLQEQPEVDLKKEIDKYFAGWMQGASDEGCFNSDSQLVSIYDCHRIARHFYELGLNARKED